MRMCVRIGIARVRHTSIAIIKMLSAVCHLFQQIQSDENATIVWRDSRWWWCIVCMWYIVKVQQEWRGNVVVWQRASKTHMARWCVIEQMQPDQIFAITCISTIIHCRCWCQFCLFHSFQSTSLAIFLSLSCNSENHTSSRKKPIPLLQKKYYPCIQDNDTCHFFTS